MKVYINIKQIGKRRNKIQKKPFVYETPPGEVRGLITETVKIMAAGFADRQNHILENPLSQNEMDDLAEIGKIAFGLHYNDRLPDEAEAVETAISAYEDGLVRIFINEKEVTGLDTPITLQEGDELTFIRMAFLAGRMF